MSQVQYFKPGPIGEIASMMEHCSQAVRIGDHIEVTAQAGRDQKAIDIHIDWNVHVQIDKAFECCDFMLKAAGGKGWSQVYKVKSYHIPLEYQVKNTMIKNFKKWMPDHEPLWTCIGVPALNEVAMLVAIEVWAYDPETPEGK